MNYLPKSYSKESLKHIFQISFNLYSKAYLLDTLRQQFKQWQHNYDSRRQLASLDSERLKDIGLTHNQAKQEYQKAFWQ